MTTTTSHPPPSTPHSPLDLDLTQLATTLLTPHQHTAHTALAALAAAAPGVPAALTDGYTVPDLAPRLGGSPPPSPPPPVEPAAR